MKALDSAVKFNTEAVETLSERLKAIMLDSNKWKDETHSYSLVKLHSLQSE